MIQLRVFSELSYFINDIKLQDMRFGVEADIYIPYYNLAIEIDGYRWHKDHEERDLKKNKIFEENKVTLIRLRQYPLVLFSTNDIQYIDKGSPTNFHLDIIKRLFLKLLNFINIDFKDYQNREFFINDEHFKEISNKVLPPNKIPITESHPKISNEWDYNKNKPLLPENQSSSSGRKVWWKCLFDPTHDSWKSRISNRCKYDTKCPTCRFTPKLEESLGILFPEISKEIDMELHPKINPLKIFPYGNKIINWVCKCGNKWKSKVSYRTKGHQKCKVCKSKNRHKPEYSKSLEFLFPKAATYWNSELNHKDFNPSTIGAYSSKRFEWKCPSCGEKWNSSVSNMVKRNRLCIKCTKKLPPIEKSLEYLFPDIAKEFDLNKNINLSPNEIFAFADKSVHWKCSFCGNEYENKVINRTKNKRGCKKCKKKIKILPKIEESLGLLFPDITKDWDTELNGCPANSAFPFSCIKRHWKCHKCGYRWTNSSSKRIYFNRGCKVCKENNKNKLKSEDNSL